MSDRVRAQSKPALDVAQERGALMSSWEQSVGAAIYAYLAHRSSLDAAGEAIESMSELAIGWDRETGTYGLYFYERVRDGHGYGDETHPPVTGFATVAAASEAIPRVRAQAVLKALKAGT